MYILSIDQGTTGTTAVLYNGAGKPAGRAYREVPQIYPNPGWVEHDPMLIWNTVVEAVEELCTRCQGPIVGVGITNQRETTILWDKKTGEPVHNAIVWQCRRTAELCRALHEYEAQFKEKTGLPVDPYFSGTKIRWLLENAKIPAPNDILFGTVDTWLIWKLTGGMVHATDYTNASRTLLFDITKRKWDERLCGLVGVPMELLPRVNRSMEEYGVVESVPVLAGVPILSVVGDQQAALFGQACFEKGQMKNTYGTGCFVVLNTGEDAIFSDKGLITTLAVDGAGGPCFALEGPIFVAGAAIQWLRDELGLLENAADSEAAALEVEDNGGVYLVPAFVGLGAPYWDMQARGTLVGLTRGTNRNHIIRAALESMAYQTLDVLLAMEEEAGLETQALSVDGGAVENDFLMQFQADIIKRPVVRPSVIESTSLGAAYMAGLKAGMWKDADEVVRLRSIEKEFVPSMDAGLRNDLLAGWQKALRQALMK